MLNELWPVFSEYKPSTVRPLTEDRAQMILREYWRNGQKKRNKGDISMMSTEWGTVVGQ